MRIRHPLKTAQFSFAGAPAVAVTLPHTWNADDGTENYKRGTGTYTIELPAPTPGKRQFVEFEGANHVAKVYCNGSFLGEHRGGFSTFRFELTDALRPADNILTVEVNNEEQDVYPQQADFTFFGGLYRKATWIETAPSHFALLKDGTDGIFITPESNGNVQIDLFPICAEENLTIAVMITDAEGQRAAQGKANADAHTSLHLKVNEPHLWQGIEDPYLYTAKAQLISADGVLDEVSVQFGFRSYAFDPDKGFFLNGKAYPLRGVSRHQDRAGKGWALSEADHEEDFSLIRKIGANAVRLAHYQQDPYVYTLCDRLGLVAWAEIPFITAFRPGDAAKENTLSQMRELIAQNYNHAAVCCWGIANEITIGGESPALVENLKVLHELVKQLDPGRPSTMALVNTVPIDSPLLNITDVVTYNQYLGWYDGRAEDNGPWLDKVHETNPNRALGLSEYGADAVLKWHSAEPKNHDYTEEYQALYHHTLLKIINDRPYLWSSFVWNMFDFAAANREEGGSKGINNKGLVSYDRRTCKEAFYLYQAYWSRESMLHLCGGRFVNRAPGQRDFTVYTNCDTVELLVNGGSYETQKVQDHAAVFRNVSLAEGDNTITAKACSPDGKALTSCICVKAVDTPDSAYVMPQNQSRSKSWFEESDIPKQLEFPEGCYSIRDTVGDLLAEPACHEPVRKVFEAISGKPIQDITRLPAMVHGMKLEMLLGSMAQKLPVGTKEYVNAKLTKIKKGE